MIVFEKTNRCSNFEVWNYLRHLTDALLKTQMPISFGLYAEKAGYDFPPQPDAWHPERLKRQIQFVLGAGVSSSGYIEAALSGSGVDQF